MGFYAPAQIVRCARDHGVEAREADVNRSLWDCTLEPVGGGGAASSIPPLDGEGGAPFGAPGGVSTPAPAFGPPPRRRKAASDLPTRGRYGASRYALPSTASRGICW
jgi:hypothetical protein